MQGRALRLARFLDSIAWDSSFYRPIVPFIISNRQKGLTGFWLLRRGVIAVFIINAAVYFGFYFSGFTGYYPVIYDKAFFFLPKHGIYRIFIFPDQIVETSSWSLGKLDGSSVKYYIGSSRISEACVYKNGKRDGMCAKWHDNGRMFSEGKYVNDLQEGKWTMWYENGEKASEGDFRKGKKEGLWTEWGIRGDKSAGEYVNGKAEGKWIVFESNGEYYEAEYKNDILNGIFTSYHSNGKKKKSGKYADSELPPCRAWWLL